MKGPRKWPGQWPPEASQDKSGNLDKETGAKSSDKAQEAPAQGTNQRAEEEEPDCLGQKDQGKGWPHREIPGGQVMADLETLFITATTKPMKGSQAEIYSEAVENGKGIFTLLGLFDPWLLVQDSRGKLILHLAFIQAIRPLAPAPEPTQPQALGTDQATLTHIWNMAGLQSQTLCQKSHPITLASDPNRATCPDCAREWANKLLGKPKRSSKVKPASRGGNK